MRGLARATAIVLGGSVLAFGTLGGAWAETRMALVMGNSSYAHGGRLANPVNDAASISKALEAIGFTVVTKTDLGRDGMIGALETFARDSNEADVALVYYAGHGMEIGGTNYLLPIDATLAADTDVEFEAVPVDRVMTAVGRAHRLKVVILDACRNNPYLDAMKRANGQRDISVGLAKPVAASGMLIAYAAREGSTSADGAGGDSPYATSLAHHLSETGVDVRILFGEVHDDVLKATGGKQEPSDYDSIGGQGFYLTPPATEASASNGATRGASLSPIATAAPGDKEVELRFWEKVDAKDPAQLKAYLDQYPKGAFVALARAKLAQASPPTAVAAPAPKTPVLAAVEPTATATAPSPADAARAAAIEAASKGEDAFRAKDYLEAMRLWRLAANQGVGAAAFRVGLLYADGLGVPRDYTQAMPWYRMAAAKGNTKAENNLGNLYNYARGVPQDYAEAMRWYRLAAEKGNAEAEDSLGFMFARGHGVAQDYVEAARWYRLSVDKDNSQAQFNLGVLYRDGQGVDLDYKEAARLFRLSAEQGLAAGQYALGLLYAHGRGVDEDLVQARFWIGKAAAQDNEFAQQWLARNNH